MADPLSFAFDAGADANDPGGYEQLLARRKLIEAMMGGKERPYPRNFGEGLAAVGEALGQRMTLGQLQQAAAIQAQRERDKVKNAEGGGGSIIPTAGAPAVTGAPPPLRVPVPAAAAGPAVTVRPTAQPMTRPVPPPRAVSPAGAAIQDDFNNGPTFPQTALDYYNAPNAGAVQVAPGGPAAMPVNAATGVTQDEANAARDRLTMKMLEQGQGDTGYPFVNGGAVASADASPIPVMAKGGDEEDGEPTPDNEPDETPAPASVAGWPAPPDEIPAPQLVGDFQTGVLPRGWPIPPSRARPQAPAPAPIAVPDVNPRIATDIGKAPSAVSPVNEPLADLSPPGPEPRPPGLLPMSQRQQRMFDLMRDTSVSPQTQKSAKEAYDQEEMFRKVAQDRSYSLYEAAHRNWQELTNRYENTPERQKTRLANEAAQYTASQRSEAEAKARADLRNAQTMSVDSKRYLYNEGSDKYTDITPETKLEDIKLSEGQGKSLKYLERATAAEDQYNKNDATSAGVSGFLYSLGSHVPVVGNYLQSDAYRQAQNAKRAWVESTVRDVSGAVLGPKEISDKLNVYFPVPGDDAKTVADKAELRRVEVESLKNSLGTAKPLAEDILNHRITIRQTPAGEHVVQQLAPAPPPQLPRLSPEQVLKLKPGTKFLTLDGREGTRKEDR